MIIPGMLCLYFLLLIAVLPVVGHWVLSPFTEAVRAVRAPRRFLLSDFIWLLVLLQASFAAARLVRPEMGLVVFVVLFSMAGIVAVWAGAVSALSRAGITEARRRGAFLVVVLPGVLFLMGLVGIGALGVLAVMIDAPPWMHGGWRILVLAGFVAAVPSLAWCLRRLTRWIAAGAVRATQAVADDAAQAE